MEPRYGTTDWQAVPQLLLGLALAFSLALIVGLISLIPYSGNTRDDDGDVAGGYCVVGDRSDDDSFMTGDAFATGAPAAGRAESAETQRTFCIGRSKSSVSTALMDLLGWLPMNVSILGLVLAARRLTRRYPDPFTPQAAAAVRRLAWWCGGLILAGSGAKALGDALLLNRLVGSADYHAADLNVWPAVVVTVALLLVAGALSSAAHRLHSSAQAKA